MLLRAAVSRARVSSRVQTAASPYRKQYGIGGFDFAPGHDQQATALRQHLKTLMAAP